MNEGHRGQGPDEHGSTAVVVLAAGAGSRFRAAHDHDPRLHGEHKLLALLPPTAERSAEPVASRSIATAIAADVGEVIVITGAVELPLPGGVVHRHNPDWQRGQMSSVHAGIAEAAARGHDRVVFGLADQPGIQTSAWRAVARHRGPIAVATYAGQRGNPVRLDQEVWHLLPATGDVGARVVMQDHPELVHEVPCTGSSADIDTVEDLRQWQSS